MAKLNDLTGQKFGKLTVLRRAEDHIQPSGQHKVVWHCVCACGNETDVVANSLTRGLTKSCGCEKTLGIVKDLTGKRFGGLVVIERDFDYVSPRGVHAACWRCECDCGNERVVKGSDLISGRVDSCGCLKETPVYHTTHGETNTRLFKVWVSMRFRCNDKKNKDYGGRGISVCEEWDNDYLAFKEWAISNGYDENAQNGECTIDRIDVNGNYEPGNVRLTNAKEQSRNRRNTVLVEYNGETVRLADLCDELNLDRRIVYGRLREGWSIDDAINEPVIRGKKRNNSIRIVYNGVSKTVKDWSIETNINISTIYGRLRRGWSPEEILTGVRIGA